METDVFVTNMVDYANILQQIADYLRYVVYIGVVIVVLSIIKGV